MSVPVPRMSSRPPLRVEAPRARGAGELVLAAGALTLLAGLAVVADSLRSPYISTDTIALVGGADAALAHLRQGQLLHWGGAYPLLQAIPAFVLRLFGVGSSDTISALVGLNVLSFAALTWASWRGLVRQTPAGAILLVAILLSGTLIWYMHASVAEPLAAAVTLGAVIASWHGRRHLAAAGLLFLAGLSKDTAVPLVLVLTVAASAGTERWADASWRWRRLGWLLAAAALSFLVTCAYNYARFGSVLDQPYLAPYLYVPQLSTQASFFAAIWLSPNGGLVPFWPSFGVLLVLAAVAVVRATRRCPSWEARLRRLAPALGTVFALLVMTAVLAKWSSPLGWVAWGSRLMLPWVPAAAYLLVAAYHDEITPLLGWIGRLPILYWPAAIALAAASIPQYVAMVRPALIWEVILPDATCTRVPYLSSGDNSYYYGCTTYMLWGKHSMLISAFQAGPNLPSLAMACACAAGLLWLLSRLRAAVVDREPAAAGAHDAAPPAAVEPHRPEPPREVSGTARPA